MLKIYDREKKKDNKLKYINKKWFKPPFRMTIVAPTMSGKSNFIKNILLNDHLGYKKYFREIYIWCGSIDDCNDLKDWIKEDRKLKDKCNIYNTFNEDEIKQLYDDIENDPLGAVLFIFDDLITANISTKYNMNIIDSCYVKGRHINLSIIITSQRYMYLKQNVRSSNLSQLVLFNGCNKTDLEMIVKEHANHLSKNSMEKLLNDYVVEVPRYTFFIIDYARPTEKRFLDGNLDEIDLTEYK